MMIIMPNPNRLDNAMMLDVIVHFLCECSTCFCFQWIEVCLLFQKIASTLISEDVNMFILGPCKDFSSKHLYL